ncbi:MAG: flagellar export protein FliJ [Bacillota bacterium]|nr:flagellar export protein FliJ [Bacillota bacterium]
MKRFRFRFQNYLNLKEQQENINLLKLARVQAEYQKEVEMLVKIQNDFRESLKFSRNARCGPIQIDLISLGTQYTQFQKEREEQQSLVVAEARNKVLLQQQEFLDVHREKKSLERLQERVWSSYWEALLREEQKYLDEIGTIRFLRT